MQNGATPVVPPESEAAAASSWPGPPTRVTPFAQARVHRTIGVAQPLACLCRNACMCVAVCQAWGRRMSQMAANGHLIGLGVFAIYACPLLVAVTRDAGSARHLLILTASVGIDCVCHQPSTACRGCQGQQRHQPASCNMLAWCSYSILAPASDCLFAPHLVCVATTALECCLQVLYPCAARATQRLSLPAPGADAIDEGP